MIIFFRICYIWNLIFAMILMYLKNSMNSKNVLWNFLYRKSLGKHVTRNAQSGEVEYSKIEYKTIKSKIKTTEICQNMQYWTWTSQWCSKACSKECRVGWIFNYEIYLPWNTKYKKMLWKTKLTLHVPRSNMRGRIFQ